MTSTEFAARYRLLKNVAMRGARSFLAQQVALGRMVMVHYLDSETPQQRSATLARLNALRPPGRDKLLEILDVDGSPVAVTLFISSFVDFATWLDQVSDPSAPLQPIAEAESPTLAPPTLPPATLAPPPPPQPAFPTPAPVQASAPIAHSPHPMPQSRTPGEFTQLFNKIEAAPEPRVAPARTPAPPKGPAPRSTPGEFTGLFGAMTPPGGTPQSNVRPEEEFDSPTLIMEKPPAVARPAAPTASSPSASPEPTQPKGAESFTAVFGAMAPSAPRDVMGNPPMPPQHEAASWPPQSKSPFGPDRVTPPPLTPAPPISAPLPPAFDAQPSMPPFGGNASSDKPGELTQLFRQWSGAMPPAAMGQGGDASPFGPRADLPAAFGADDRIKPPAPLADTPPSAPSLLPPPSLGAAAQAAPIALGGMLSAPPPSMPRGSSGPSNLADPSPNASAMSGALPPVPTWGTTPAAPAPNMGGIFGGTAAGQSEYTRILHGITLPPPPPVVIQAPGPEAATAAPGKKPLKSLVPLVVALGAIVLLTIAILAYFIFSR